MARSAATSADCTSAATFGRERKSLRSASLNKKEKIVDKENSSATTVNRRASVTPAPTQREPVRQLQAPSPVKKGRACKTASGKNNSPTKAISQIVQQNSQPNSPKKKLLLEDVLNVSPQKVLQDLQNVSPKKSPTKSTPKLFRPDVSRFASARRALSTAFPDTLVGRVSQLNDMKAFLHSNLSQPKKPAAARSKKSAQKTEIAKKSLYVSGPPGTGKTTCLKYLLSNMDPSVSAQLTCGFINCMALGSSGKVFSKVAEAILPSSKHGLIGNCSEAKKLLEEEIVNSKKWILLVLDEIDQLESKCQEVLYTLFEWPYLNNSKLILVGIANALDLTDRILPRISVSFQHMQQQYRTSPVFQC